MPKIFIQMHMYICSCLVFLAKLVFLHQLSQIPGHGEPFGANMKPMGVTVNGKFSIPQVFYGHFVKASRPLHMKSALKETKHPGLDWTDDFLRNLYGTIMVSVEIGKREVRGRPKQWIRLNKFIDDYPHSDIYLVHSIEGVLKDLIQIPNTLQCGGFQKALQEAVMWMGKGPLQSVLHYDELDNLLCLFDGTKDVILIDKVYKDKVESHGFNQAGHFSAVDLQAVDMHTFPQFQNLPWYRVHMTAGDCLYIPYRWYHQVTTTGERNLAVNIWFSHLWWFDDEDCAEFKTFPTFLPLSTYGFASPNEVLRSHWLQTFEGIDDDIGLNDFLGRVSSGSEEHRKKVFSLIDQDEDSLLSWEELYAFDINKALLLYADVFFIASNSSQQNLEEPDGESVNKVTSSEDENDIDDVTQPGEKVTEAEVLSQNITIDRRHFQREEL